MESDLAEDMNKIKLMPKLKPVSNLQLEAARYAWSNMTECRIRQILELIEGAPDADIIAINDEASYRLCTLNDLRSILRFAANKAFYRRVKQVQSDSKIQAKRINALLLKHAKGR